MGDLRDDLIRLAEGWESRVHGGSGSGKRSTYRTCASELRCLLARHPAPSPRSEAPALPVRNTSTEEGRAFWSSAEQAAAEVESWPDWKRAGINEAESRARARSEAEPEAPREVYFARWVASRPCECAPGRPPCFPCGARAVTARAPVPAESATTRTENCGHVDDGWEQFPCTLPTGHGGDHAWTGSVSLRSAATKGEEDGR